MITLVLLKLTAVEPFAITAPEVAEASDLPVVKDPRTGKLVLPGTTVAGSLRAHTARKHDLRVAADWFGPEVGPNGTIDASSRVRIVGALLHDTQGMPIAATLANPQVQTAINRHRRAAEVNTRRDASAVPAGVQFSVFIRIDDLDPASAEGVQLLDLTASWNPTLGKAKTNGTAKFGSTPACTEQSISQPPPSVGTGSLFTDRDCSKLSVRPQ